MGQIVRKLGIVATVSAVLLTGVAVNARPRLNGEEQLTKMLEGRVAGAPVDCIAMRNVGGSTVIDKTAIVYGSGRTLYVQRPRIGVTSLDSNDILVTELRTSQLCSIDTVQLRERNGFFWRGFVGLDKFVPYTKPAQVALAH